MKPQRKTPDDPNATLTRKEIVNASVVILKKTTNGSSEEGYYAMPKSAAYNKKIHMLK
jgi:hypothetical protein